MFVFTLSRVYLKIAVPSIPSFHPLPLLFASGVDLCSTLIILHFFVFVGYWWLYCVSDDLHLFILQYAMNLAVFDISVLTWIFSQSSPFSISPSRNRSPPPFRPLCISLVVSALWIFQIPICFFLRVLLAASCSLFHLLSNWRWYLSMADGPCCGRVRAAFCCLRPSTSHSVIAAIQEHKKSSASGGNSENNYRRYKKDPDDLGRAICQKSFATSTPSIFA